MDSYKDVKYRQLEEPNSKNNSSTLKIIIILLTCMCVALLVYVVFMFRQCDKEMENGSSENGGLKGHMHNVNDSVSGNIESASGVLKGQAFEGNDGLTDYNENGNVGSTGHAKSGNAKVTNVGHEIDNEVESDDKHFREKNTQSNFGIYSEKTTLNPYINANRADVINKPFVGLDELNVRRQGQKISAIPGRRDTTSSMLITRLITSKPNRYPLRETVKTTQKTPFYDNDYQTLASTKLESIPRDGRVNPDSQQSPDGVSPQNVPPVDMDSPGNNTMLDQLHQPINERNPSIRKSANLDANEHGNITSHIQDHVTTHVKITRQVLMNRLREVIDNLRNGKEDRLSMQVSLLFLQQALHRMDHTGGSQDRGDNYANSGVTLETPRVRSMMEKLTLTPSALDVFDFKSKPDNHYRCLLMELHLIPDPLICLKDRKYNDGQPSIADKKPWQHETLKSFLNLLTSDDSLQFVDIGSGEGVYSLAAAAANRQVLSVEPNIRNIMPFFRSIQMNSFEKVITLVTNSLSDQHKLVQLIQHEGHRADTNTVEITEYMLRNNVIRAEDVSRAVTLDDLEQAMALKRAVLKIDLHKDNAGVFKSARSFFANVDVQYVIMEWKYITDYLGMDYIAKFLLRRNYRPYYSWNGEVVTGHDLTKNLPVVFWKKYTTSKRRRPM